MSSIFNSLFYRPLLNILGVIITIVPGHSLGVAVIILTLLVSIALLPLSMKMRRSQRVMQEIQPEIDKIRQQTKDKNEQARRTMELYREKKINPFLGFLFILVQIPLFLALFQVFKNLDNLTHDAYEFLPLFPPFNPIFIGGIDLIHPHIVLAVLAGVFQLTQGILTLWGQPKQHKPSSEFASALQKQMTFTMPLFIVFISMQLPSAMALYWTTLSLFAIVHEGFGRLYGRDSSHNNK
ncbi:MAG: membrane protein insertase YidC [Candidatus Ryanbacteria bacterium]|nr:membrane protein insertase YidC [Candidatus Ryanbacteria bacterium]